MRKLAIASRLGQPNLDSGTHQEWGCRSPQRHNISADKYIPAIPPVKERKRWLIIGRKVSESTLKVSKASRRTTTIASKPKLNSRSSIKPRRRETAIRTRASPVQVRAIQCPGAWVANPTVRNKFAATRKAGKRACSQGSRESLCRFNR